MLPKIQEDELSELCFSCEEPIDDFGAQPVPCFYIDFWGEEVNVMYCGNCHAIQCLDPKEHPDDSIICFDEL